MWVSGLKTSSGRPHALCFALICGIQVSLRHQLRQELPSPWKRLWHLFSYLCCRHVCTTTSSSSVCAKQISVVAGNIKCITSCVPENISKNALAGFSANVASHCLTSHNLVFVRRLYPVYLKPGRASITSQSYITTDILSIQGAFETSCSQVVKKTCGSDLRHTQSDTCSVGERSSCPS